MRTLHGRCGSRVPKGSTFGKLKALQAGIPRAPNQKAPDRSGAFRSGFSQSRLGEVAQHVVEHAAILKVFDLDFGIDPAFYLDRFRCAVRILDRAGNHA